MDYMRTARSKGLRERSIIRRHGLRNAMIPVITLIGIDFGTAIGAAVLTETVFSWPGLGSQIADSVNSRDLPVILGLTLVVVLAFGVINLLVDLSYAWFDPRIRLGAALMTVMAFPGHAAQLLAAHSLALPRSHARQGAPVTTIIAGEAELPITEGDTPSVPSSRRQVWRRFAATRWPWPG